jgi:hypothetical protein
MRRVQRVYRYLPDGVKLQVLQLIERAAVGRPSFTFLRIDNNRELYREELLVNSHLGGAPYAEAGEEWPTCTRAILFKSPAKFLIQVRLNEPSLGMLWQGRLLTVFFWLHSVVVRSYALPSADRYVPLHAPSCLIPCVPLTPVRMPVHQCSDEEEKSFCISSAELCEIVPDVRQVLSPYTDDCIALLTQILHPNASFCDFTESTVAYVGGEPMHIQDPPEATCDVCNQPLRFLFQFGDIIPHIKLGDSGACYVYGCDRHPDHCKGFFESH